MEMVQLTFDYGSLDAETRIVVQQRTTEIRDLMRNTAENIVKVGEKLAEVRGRLKNGGFSDWLEAEFSWSRRTAYNFISVYERLGGRANFAQIDVATSALYLIAAESTPEAAVDEVLERAEAGERMTHSLVKEIVAEHKPTPELPGQMIFDPNAGIEKQEDNEPPVHEPERRTVVPGSGQLVKPSYAPPKPKEAVPAVSLDFSQPATAAEESPEPEMVADVVLTIRLKRPARGAEPEAVELEINAEDGVLRGRFPSFYNGEYGRLAELVSQAVEEYLASEEETISDE